MWEIAIAERSIRAAFHGEPYVVTRKTFRRKWVAKLAVWWVNHLGAGVDYEYATFMGRAL